MLGLIVVLPMPSVYAANTQGLQWALKTGDRLDYVGTRYWNNSMGHGMISGKVYLLVDYLPSLPDILTSLRELDSVRTKTYWENGSVLPDGLAFFTYLPINMLLDLNIPFFLPIGNWSLVGSLPYVNATYTGYVIENESTWSRHYDLVRRTLAFNETVSFLKSDGALYHYRRTLNITERALNITDIQDQFYGSEISRIGGGIDSVTLAAVASISVELVAAAIIIRKRRR